VRSDADPTPCPFFCCAAVLSLSTCSSFALAWCAKVLTSFMMSCRTAQTECGQHQAPTGRSALAAAHSCQPPATGPWACEPAGSNCCTGIVLVLHGSSACAGYTAYAAAAAGPWHSGDAAAVGACAWTAQCCCCCAAADAALAMVLHWAC
jgi:hypothetical protein